ncbi:S-adenosyl-L-methionine-dependent methyltransferase [Phyllosticta citriasiana]|uniref:S-adenosyl-L-methionine-dependent methyltransferase n=1 Tax=Phyllosticta citriasiana TaxID=595635 RepID=A0ABR1KZ34_9PEZI
MSDTAPSEYFEILELHDREFQKLSVESQIYCVPVDVLEEQRLENQHQVLRYLFDGRLFFPPVKCPRRILDCGYGRGHWALDMALNYPHSEVTAIDLYPAPELPDDQPDNLECEVWDLNEPLVPSYKPNTYDLIHSRFVAPGIKKHRWPGYMRDMCRLLRPGGWVQTVELYYIIQSDSGLLTDGHALMQWSNGYRYSMDSDRDPRAGRNLGQLMRNAGLEDVNEVTYRLPIGGWSTDPKMRHVGELNLENFGAMLDSLAVWPFIEKLEWSKDQVAALTCKAREEAKDTRLKLYMPLTVVWGRRQS